MVSQRLKLSSPVLVNDSQKRPSRLVTEGKAMRCSLKATKLYRSCVQQVFECRRELLPVQPLKPPLVPARAGYVGRLPVYWLVFCWRTSTTTQAATPRVWELECGEERNTIPPPATPGLLSRPYLGLEPELAGKARNQTESNSCLCRRAPSLTWPGVPPNVGLRQQIQIQNDLRYVDLQRGTMCTEHYQAIVVCSKENIFFTKNDFWIGAFVVFKQKNIKKIKKLDR